MGRILSVLGIVVVVACIAAMGFNFARNPMEARKASLEQDVSDALQDAEDGDTSSGTADYAALKKTVESRPELWDRLTPAPTPTAQLVDVSKLVEGINVLPGTIGSGDARKVRLTTPTNSVGQYYRKGDAVTPNVVVQEVTGDAVVLGVKQSDKVVPHRMPLP